MKRRAEWEADLDALYVIGELGKSAGTTNIMNGANLSPSVVLDKLRRMREKGLVKEVEVGTRRVRYELTMEGRYAIRDHKPVGTLLHLMKAAKFRYMKGRGTLGAYMDVLCVIDASGEGARITHIMYGTGLIRDRLVRILDYALERDLVIEENDGIKEDDGTAGRTKKVYRLAPDGEKVINYLNQIDGIMNLDDIAKLEI